MTFSEWVAQDGWDYLGFILVMFGLAAPFLVALFLKHYFSYRSEIRRELNEMSQEVAKLEGESVAKRLRALQTRVETLEAVVTDSKYDLDKRIRSL